MLGVTLRDQKPNAGIRNRTNVKYTMAVVAKKRGHGRGTLREWTRGTGQGDFLNGDHERTPERVAEHRRAGRPTSDDGRDWMSRTKDRQEEEGRGLHARLDHEKAEMMMMMSSTTEVTSLTTKSKDLIDLYRRNFRFTSRPLCLLGYGLIISLYYVTLPFSRCYTNIKYTVVMICHTWQLMCGS